MQIKLFYKDKINDSILLEFAAYDQDENGFLSLKAAIQIFESVIATERKYPLKPITHGAGVITVGVDGLEVTFGDTTAKLPWGDYDGFLEKARVNKSDLLRLERILVLGDSSEQKPPTPLIQKLGAPNSAPVHQKGWLRELLSILSPRNITDIRDLLIKLSIGSSPMIAVFYATAREGVVLALSIKGDDFNYYTVSMELYEGITEKRLFVFEDIREFDWPDIDVLKSEMMQFEHNLKRMEDSLSYLV